jgi:hypothetical protein
VKLLLAAEAIIGSLKVLLTAEAIIGTLSHYCQLKVLINAS